MRADHAISYSPEAEKRSPDDVQREASDPGASVWVGASAGTGKTKVLTDRLLRLLLPQADGSPGSEPHRILCLTFTKAAASEMTIRLFTTLGRWAVMPVEPTGSGDPNLRETLRTLTGVDPNAQQIEAAQQLFARVLDAPAGLRILTIHSFCQSVLGRFPLEADLQPHFNVLDESAASDLIAQAQQIALARAGEKTMAGSALQNALEHLTSQQTEDQFAKLANDICKERGQMAGILRGFKNVDSIYAAVCEFYGIRPGQDEKAYLADAIYPDPDNEERIKRVALIMQQQGKKTDIERADFILGWLSRNEGERLQHFEEYRNGFLTKGGTVFAKNFPTNDVKKACQDAEEILHEEGRRLEKILDTIKAIKAARLTRDVLILGEAVNRAYEALKAEKGGLDYDDLILKTFELLRGRTLTLKGLGEGRTADVTDWIMYKLDQGIDHVLVDEAQDTNPEQWAIIEALCDDFFSGMGTREERVRTVFAVGDMKQSIYSFQRAAPEEFRKMKSLFKQKTVLADQEFKDVSLNMSFRSTEAVLKVVDKTFDRNDLRLAMGGEIVSHNSMRKGQAGLVEMWPIIETEKPEQRGLWDPPVSVHEGRESVIVLAERVADQIEGWLRAGELLPAYGRAVQPGDIMILVRSRTGLVDAMIRALKLRGVPVSGMDRMNLAPQIVVQDLLAAAKFCLLPSDDLTLACFLKSPLIGWGDEELFSVAAGRDGDLWSALVHFEPQANRRLLDDSSGLTQERAEEVAGYLQELRAEAQRGTAYGFFSHVLLSACPGDVQSGLQALRRRLGEDALDPLEEFLRLALDFGKGQPDVLELFVDSFESHTTEIKREMEEAGGQVRIMTVHGSKGLQAPIVILPDTIPSSSSSKVSGILWPDKTGLKFPLWAPRKDDEPNAYQAMKARLAEKAMQEDARLLYVAMTRAADRLYVCGRKGARSEKAYEVSWYRTVREGMLGLEGVEETSEGLLRYRTEQNAEPDKRRDGTGAVVRAHETPSWLRHEAPDEATPPRPLIPSKQLAGDEADDYEIAAISPLAGGQDFRFLRGNLTHKLLQFLPHFAVESRENAAMRFVDKNGGALPSEVRESIVREVLAIFEHPDTSVFFDQNGLSEVPLTALLEDNRALSGQIDRLVVENERVWVLDYKTNRPPPERPEDVPRAYLRQMRAYRDAIAGVYPGRQIVCGLFWTDGTRLMILPDDVMNSG